MAERINHHAKIPLNCLAARRFMGIIAPSFGEMDERFKSPPWKGGIGATLSRVRIPLSPPK